MADSGTTRCAARQADRRDREVGVGNKAATRQPLSFDEELVESGMRAVRPMRRKGSSR